MKVHAFQTGKCEENTLPETWTARIDLRSYDWEISRGRSPEEEGCFPQKNYCLASGRTLEDSLRRARGHYDLWRENFERLVRQHTPLAMKWAERNERLMLGVDWYGAANRALWNAASTSDTVRNTDFRFYLNFILNREAHNLRRIYWDKEKKLHKKSLDGGEESLSYYEETTPSLRVSGGYEGLERREAVEEVRVLLDFLDAEQREAVWHLCAEGEKRAKLQRRWNRSPRYVQGKGDEGLQILRRRYYEAAV